MVQRWCCVLWLDGAVYHVLICVQLWSCKQASKLQRPPATAMMHCCATDWPCFPHTYIQQHVHTCLVYVYCIVLHGMRTVIHRAVSCSTLGGGLSLRRSVCVRLPHWPLEGSAPAGDLTATRLPLTWPLVHRFFYQPGPGARGGPLCRTQTSKHCTAQYCTLLHYTVPLYRTALHCTAYLQSCRILSRSSLTAVLPCVSAPEPTMDTTQNARRALVLYGSETGSAQDVAEEMGRIAERLRFDTELAELNAISLVCEFSLHLPDHVLTAPRGNCCTTKSSSSPSPPPARANCLQIARLSGRRSAVRASAQDAFSR